MKNPIDGDHKAKRASGRRGGSGRKKPTVRRLKDDSDSEEEWQPWMEEQKQRPKRRGGCGLNVDLILMDTVGVFKNHT